MCGLPMPWDRVPSIPGQVSQVQVSQGSGGEGQQNDNVLLFIYTESLFSQHKKTFKGVRLMDRGGVGKEMG